VQSGSGEVLRRMGRRYAPEDVLRVIERLRAVKDDPFIACDIIAGFPGETERHFEETLELCRQAGFARIHAFPFSRRRGTAAWDYKPRIPEREAVRRVKALNALSDEGRKAYVARWIGRETGGIALSADDSGVLVLTDNYLRLRVPLPGGSPPQRGQRLRCLITAAGDTDDANAFITLNESKG
jgi:threonylcarbamoyladenosine tRNA methylthiotransferase MtaB